MGIYRLTLLRKSMLFSLMPLVLVAVGYGQASGATATSHKAIPAKAVSLRHLYWHFLVYQQHLEDAATAREKQGQNAEWLRNYVQQKLDFTDEEYAPIRASARRLSTNIASMNGEAKTIISADRAAKRQGLIAADATPPGLEKLKTLTSQREGAIQAEIDSINKSLPVSKQVALQKFLIDQFSQNVISAKVDLARRSTRPFVGKTKPASVQP